MKSSDQCFCPTCGQPVALQKEPPKNGADITAIFEDFWDKYPEIRKTNKYRAQTEWSAARFVLPSNKDILNALDAFVASQEWKKENGKFIYNGLDRVDNNLPHTLENCVTCCKHCNYAKRDMSQQKFLEYRQQRFNYFQRFWISF